MAINIDENPFFCEFAYFELNTMATKMRDQDPEFMALQKVTRSISGVNWKDYDVVYFTGGHGAIWIFLTTKNCINIQPICMKLGELSRLFATELPPYKMFG